jgi:pimeloyl-ACP methyl ester carboxylesterase
MWLSILWFAVAVYCGVLIGLATMQRTFMYHPERGEEKALIEQAASHNLQPWRDAKGELIGWKRTNPSAKHRMLILHGNGGQAITRTYLMNGYHKEDWDFYAVEYPGYGWRSGSPSESTLVAASEHALQELLRIDKRPLYITGESLGTGVACLLAAKYPKQVRGLFMVTPYTSTVDVARGRFPIFPVRFVMQDKYEAATALQKYSGPVAVLLAGNDFIVPTRFGQKLYDDYNGPKRLWIQPDAGHNSLDFDAHAPMWQELSRFLTMPGPASSR